MKKRLLFTLFVLFSILSCRQEFNFQTYQMEGNSSYQFTKDNVVTKKLVKSDLESRVLIKQQVALVGEFLKSGGKKPILLATKTTNSIPIGTNNNDIDIYTDVFEEVTFRDAKYYSFLILEGDEYGNERKLVIKAVNDEPIEKYIVKYKRINGLAIDPDSFELEKIQEKTETYPTLGANASPTGNINREAVVMSINSFQNGCTIWTITSFECGYEKHHTNGQFCTTYGKYMPMDIVSASYDPSCNSGGGGGGGGDTGDGGDTGGGIPSPGPGNSQNNTPPVITIPSDAPLYIIQMPKTGMDKNPPIINPLNLSSEEITQINSNNEVRRGIFQYLADNGEYPFLTLTPYFATIEAQNFAKFTLQFFEDNPETTWEEFENWFMGDKEGRDGEYVSEDLIEYETPVIQQSLPTLQQWYSSFPKIEENGYWKPMDSPLVYQMVGGTLYTSHLNDTNGSYQNACAIRGSRGLLYSGITIPIIRKGQQQLTQKGGDGKNYILAATTFLKYMKDTFGDTPYKLEGADANNPTKVANLLKGKNGIYVIENANPGPTSQGGAGYSGHVDAIVNGICISGAYTQPKGGVKSIRVWVLN